MIEELRIYLDELFADAPKTRAAYELKEELMANSTERYTDLTKSGMPEKEAYDIVINSIGDIHQLFEATEPKELRQPLSESLVKKLALYKSVAIGLYIFGFIMAITISEFTAFDNMGFIVMLLISAIATCILVYIGAAYPKYKKSDNTVVEEFKEWNSGQQKQKSIYASISTIIWMLVLIIYFIISFVTMAWYITWVMFLVGACAQAILNLLFHINDK